MQHPVSVSEWRAGWPALLASMIGYGSSFGLFILASSSFIEPVRRDFGWTTARAAILPISSLTMAVLFPFVGRFIDRWGARPFAIGGMTGLALCFLALAAFPANLLLHRALAILIGFCMAACGPMTFARGVGSWFVANRGTALGFLLSGLSIGGFVGIPLAGYLIGIYGWRAAYLGLAASMLIVGLPPVVMFFRERGGAPSSATEPAHGYTVAEAFRDPRFWMLLTTFIFSALPIGVFSAHLVPILTGRGFSPGEAASLGAIFAAFTGVSRIGIGFLLDRFRDYIVAAACLMSAGAGAWGLFHSGGTFAYLQTQASICLVGLAFGAEGDLAAYFTLKLFGMRAFAAITGCFSTAIALGTAVGGFVGSTVVDWTGAYDPLAPFMGASLLISGTLMLAQRLGRRSPPVNFSVESSLAR